MAEDSEDFILGDDIDGILLGTEERKHALGYDHIYQGSLAQLESMLDVNIILYDDEEGARHQIQSLPSPLKAVAEDYLSTHGAMTALKNAKAYEQILLLPESARELAERHIAKRSLHSFALRLAKAYLIIQQLPSEQRNTVDRFLAQHPGQLINALLHLILSQRLEEFSKDLRDRYPSWDPMESIDAILFHQSILALTGARRQLGLLLLETGKSPKKALELIHRTFDQST